MDKKIELYEAILKSREDRYNKQEELILKFYPYTLISFTLNTPGFEKRNDLYRRIYKEGLKAIIDIFLKKGIEIKHKEEIDKITGFEAFIVIDYDVIMTKKMMIGIEEDHFLGRIFDIDVFDYNHYKISRSDILYEGRKCLLCEEKAFICMREKRHSYEELVGEIERLSNEYFR